MELINLVIWLLFGVVTLSKESITKYAYAVTWVSLMIYNIGLLVAVATLGGAE